MPFLDNIMTTVNNWFWTGMSSILSPERVAAMNISREYYIGRQRKPLKTKAGQFDDNLITNLVGLAVDRSTSMLFGGGVEFTVPEGGEDAKQVYLDLVWQANKKDILFHRLATDGDIYGTAYLKIIPNGREMNGVIYPRVVLLDPSLIEIHCDPMDMENVYEYVFEVKKGEEAYREITRQAQEGERFNLGDGTDAVSPAGMWVVEKYKSGRGGNWILDGEPVLFPYPFPPILHIQNLPSVHSVYGTPGIDGLIEIQDKYNFTVSNLLKIVRYHSHPKTWARGIPANAGLEKVSWGADEIIKITSENGAIANLEMSSDLASSRNIARDLRQSVFDLARVVDITSITDKIGSLTNFGLRLLYSDALAKNATRRLLYGEGLVELNRRLLIMNNMDGTNDITWGADLPADEKEDAALIIQDLAAGLVSKETASEERGYTWKSYVNESNVPVDGEEDKIKAEATANSNLENIALANLFAGREVPQ